MDDATPGTAQFSMRTTDKTRARQLTASHLMGAGVKYDTYTDEYNGVYILTIIAADDRARNALAQFIREWDDEPIETETR
jgi:hypothetical protein